VAGKGTLPAAGVIAACAPGEEEPNFEDIEVSQEFLRDGLGDGAFENPFSVAGFSVEVLLENPGRCGIFLGNVGGASFV
jgi:hypothetical protein